MSDASPAMVVRRLLINQGIGAESGAWQTFVSFLPETWTDEQMAVYDTSGFKDGRIMGGVTIMHPGVQVRVRSPRYDHAFLKAVDVVQFFDTVNQLLVAVDGQNYRIQCISRTSDILYAGVEEEGDRRRHNHTANVTLTIRKES